MTLRLSILILVFTISPVRAQDTFSIVAIDTVTGEVGSAGASCLDRTLGLGAAIISDVHPGVGVIHTQAQWDPNNQLEAGGEIEDDSTPQQILNFITTHDASGRPAIRQYGIVSLTHIPHAAAFTGDSCFDWKGHIVGPYYSIQGNILKGREIIEQMEAKFLSTQGSLADRLMAALEGANVRGADTRCYDSGTSSLSSFLRVAQKNDDPNALTLDIIIPQVKKGTEPIDSLQHRYDQWKAQHASVSADAAQGAINVYAEGTSSLHIVGLGATETAILDLCAIDGRALLHQTLAAREDQVALNAGMLRSGIYLYRMLTSAGRLATGKLLIVNEQR